MKHLKRKLMMTLALLLTAVTGAWATDYTTLAVGDVIKVGDKFSPTAESEGAINDFGVESGYTYKLIRADVDNDYYVTEETDGDYYVFEYAANEFRYIHFEKAFKVTAISDGLVVTKIETLKGKQSYTLALHEPAPAATTVDLTWDATAKTATLTNGMPAGNVTVSVEYFPQAEFATSTGETPVALAPTAIADVPANTDGAIVEAGTVANIGTSEVKQGTLMYFVIQPTDNTIPTAPDYNTDGWSENVPTADGLKQGNAYVWYYIKGAEPAQGTDRTDDNTRSDSDIKALGTTGYVTLGAEPTYDISLNQTDLADGEPALWSAKSTKVTTAVNLGEADLEGVKKGETVTVTYSGSKKVIGVKAEKKGEAVENAYQKWDADQKKLVATVIPTTATKVENANADVSWQAGTYVVEDDVIITGNITLSGNVNLIIKDGATLTANKIQGGNKNLSIYGQAQMTGELVVNSETDNAIKSINTLEVHSAKVTATSSGNSCGGFNYIGTINVYGGSVDAENTAADDGYGIGLKAGGFMNIYGGEVKAEGKGDNTKSNGINGSDPDDKATVTVYGGKLWAGNADDKALRYVNLQKGAGFTGKIETSNDNSAWAEYTGDDAPTTKYVRVGY